MKTNWFKATIVVIVATFAVVALQTKTGAGPGQKKITICHKGQTLELPEPAVQAHLGHGDTLGPCTVTPSKNQ